jgi:hypothetical protein
MHVAPKWPRFWEDDMHKNRAGDRSCGQETGVPPIAGTPWNIIKADLERHDHAELIVI